jgi:AcrR family transcriptional regulator
MGVADGLEDRVFERAERLLFDHGCRATTMDALAADLGVSKKTLYTVVSSKEQLIERMILRFIEATTRQLDQTLDEPSLDFPTRKDRFFGIVFQRLGRLHPRFFADLQRAYPQLSQRVDAIRAEFLPSRVRRLLEAGINAKQIRPDADPMFFSAVFLASVQALMRGETLDRLQLHPAEAARRLARLLFDGVAAAETPKI